MNIFGFSKAQLVAPLENEAACTLCLEEKTVARHTNEEWNSESHISIISIHTG